MIPVLLTLAIIEKHTQYVSTLAKLLFNTLVTHHTQIHTRTCDGRAMNTIFRELYPSEPDHAHVCARYGTFETHWNLFQDTF